MNENHLTRREMIAAASVLGCLGLGSPTARAAALDNGANSEADFFLPNDGPVKFELRGKEKGFGRYTCFGEVVSIENGDALEPVMHFGTLPFRVVERQPPANAKLRGFCRVVRSRAPIDGNGRANRRSAPLPSDAAAARTRVWLPCA